MHPHLNTHRSNMGVILGKSDRITPACLILEPTKIADQNVTWSMSMSMAPTQSLAFQASVNRSSVHLVEKFDRIYSAVSAITLSRMIPSIDVCELSFVTMEHNACKVDAS